MSTLADLRSEVTGHGFDVGFAVALTDVDRYLNEAQRRVARQIDYYAEEAQQDFATVTSTATYAWPTDLGRIRYLRNVDDSTILGMARLRVIDSWAPSNGKPYLYAVDGPALTLYPTPDAAYNLELRYWALPPLLVADSDTPALPSDYHEILTYYAIQRCFEREDDQQMGAYWEGRWLQALSEMKVDVKFPSADGPRQVQSMWDSGTGYTPLPYSLP